MKFMLRRGRSALAMAMIVIAAGAAYADEPAPAQIDVAKKILVAVGLKASIDQIVPAMLGQLQGQVMQIHPEMGKPLHETLVTLLPEFMKGEDDVFNDTARALATHLNGAELQQTLAFFDSETGRKYTLAQAAVLNALGASGAAWREKLTSVMLTRTREEMKKKGFAF